MESKVRTIAKSITWQILGLVVTSILAWFQTGSVIAAISFALSTAITGFIFFFVHERIWARIGWGLRNHQA